MAFYHSSSDIRLIDNHILVAHCKTRDGELNESSVDLNEFIGNNDGTAHILTVGNFPPLITLP